jgi:Spy/CpxP family protein refolding chaperone
MKERTMNQNKNKICVTAGLTAVCWMISGLFALSFAADTGVNGTDSAGSYSFETNKKSEGSKSKASGEKKKCDKEKFHSSKGHGHKFGKEEGSGHGKSYKGHGKSYGGHGGQKYSHGKKGHGGYGKGGHHAGGHSKQGPFAHVLKFKEKLGLTADQIEQIKANAFEFNKLGVEIRAAHEIAHLGLDQLVHSGNVDEAKMREVADRLSSIKSTKIHAMIEAKIFLLKILTPEQRQKIGDVHGTH